jgi:hypothetical protein
MKVIAAVIGRQQPIRMRRVADRTIARFVGMKVIAAVSLSGIGAAVSIATDHLRRRSSRPATPSRNVSVAMAISLQLFSAQ